MRNNRKLQIQQFQRDEHFKKHAKKHEQLTETRIQHKIQEAERLEEKAKRLAQEIAALQQEVLITTPEQLDDEIKKIQKSPLTASKKESRNPYLDQNASKNSEQSIHYWTSSVKNL